MILTGRFLWDYLVESRPRRKMKVQSAGFFLFKYITVYCDELIWSIAWVVVVWLIDRSIDCLLYWLINWFIWSFIYCRLHWLRGFLLSTRNFDAKTVLFFHIRINFILTLVFTLDYESQRKSPRKTTAKPHALRKRKVTGPPPVLPCGIDGCPYSTRVQHALTNHQRNAHFNSGRSLHSDENAWNIAEKSVSLYPLIEHAVSKQKKEQVDQEVIWSASVLRIDAEPNNETVTGLCGIDGCTYSTTSRQGLTCHRRSVHSKTGMSEHTFQ